MTTLPNHRSAIRKIKKRGTRANLPEPFKSAVDWIPDDADALVEQVSIWLPPLDRRDMSETGVLLGGEAAHVTLPCA